jgi:hypothetical protein
MYDLSGSLKMLGWTASLTLFFAANPSSIKGKDAAPEQNAPGPAPEMQQIKFLQGKWHCAETYEKTDMYPKGGQGTGSYVAKAGPGGFSQIVDFQDEGPDGWQLDTK